MAGEFDKYAREANLRKSIDKSRKVLRELWDLKKSFIDKPRIEGRRQPGPADYTSVDRLPTIKYSLF